MKGIEYFKNLSIRKEKANKMCSGLTGIMMLMGIIGALVWIIIIGVLGLSINYIFLCMIVLIPVGYVVIYLMFMGSKSQSSNITKKIYKLGLKLVSLKLPEDSEYLIFHTKNGDFYLLRDLKAINDDEIKIPNNAEKVVICDTFTSKIILAFQK